MVRKIREGGPISRTRMGEGFVITSANGQNITSIEDLNKVLGRVSGTVKVEGVYPGTESVYPYVINME
jgi:S1-C subfamily serine protease